MSTGGYKCVKFSWQGGLTGTADDKIKFVVNGICDAIIGANVGWQLDTLTPTSSDFVKMPTYIYNANYLKILKLEFDNHIYKFGIGYLCKPYNDMEARMKPNDCSAMIDNNNVCIQRGNFGGGLYIGMIKDGNFITDSTYGIVWNETGDFIRWMPFDNYFYSYGMSFLDENSSSYLYSYYVILKNAQIAILPRSSKWNSGARLKCIVVGEIFKETGHSVDSHTMGAFYLANSRDGEYDFNGASFGINGSFNSAKPNTTCPVQNQVFTSSGSVKFGYYSETAGNLPTYIVNFLYFSNVVGNDVSPTTSSPGGRWTPCCMTIQTSDQDTYGVVPGDGFKGYIDTDLLRGVNPNYSYGQQLQGGDFVYLGGGFAIGWDADNEILLF